MGDCPNFNCDKQTWGTNIRCSQCRHARRYTCASCGDSIDYARAIRCKVCSRMNKNEGIRIFQNTPEQKAIILQRKREKYRLAKNV